MVHNLSRRLFWLTSLAMVFMTLSYLIWMAGMIADPAKFADQFPYLPKATVLSRSKVFVVVVVFALEMAHLIFAFDQMRWLFGRYLEGQVLTAVAAGHIWRIGQALVAIGFIVPVILPPQHVILSADNPVGQRVVRWVLSSDNLIILLTGGLLTVIGWAMTEAARAAKENEGFV
jgi:hypothetical protein